MPPILKQPTFGFRGAIQEDFRYKYPEGRNLRPDTELHNRIVTWVMQRVYDSHMVLSRRYSAWREIDRVMTAYIQLDKEEEDIRSVDKRRPISIVFPVSYANLQVLLTYVVSALADEPIFRFSAVGGADDVYKEALLEAVIAYQARRAKMALELTYAWSDAYKYGIGGTVVDWITRGGARVRNSRAISSIAYEGNWLTVIDPYRMIFDVALPIHRLQDMQYIGFWDTYSYSQLLREELESEWMFNVRYIPREAARSFLRDESARADRESSIDAHASWGTRFPGIDVVTLIADIIPEELGLSRSRNPERWLFRVAADSVLLEARRLETVHDMYPVAIFAPDHDGHSILPISRMEIEYGLQHAINFLWNSHMKAVRRWVNNVAVVDPGLVNYEDVVKLGEEDGGIVRARAAVWGLGRASEGLDFKAPIDVTRQNIGDISALLEVMPLVSGATDPITGNIPSRGERVSAAEARQAALAAMSRLAKDARMIFWQGMYDLGFMLALNTIEYMSDDVFVRIVSDSVPDLKPGTVQRVSPEMFEGLQFDVLPSDGTLPGTSSDPQSLIQFLQIVLQSGAVQMFDVPRMIASIGRRLGIKEIPMYMKVQPDDQVMNAAERGDAVPVNGNGGANVEELLASLIQQ